MLGPIITFLQVSKLNLLHKPDLSTVFPVISAPVPISVPHEKKFAEKITFFFQKWIICTNRVMHLCILGSIMHAKSMHFGPRIHGCVILLVRIIHVREEKNCNFVCKPKKKKVFCFW